jgi:hypothetical protein
MVHLRLVLALYLLSCEIALLFFFTKTSIQRLFFNKDQYGLDNVASWDEFVQTIGGYFRDMLLFAFGWPYFLWRFVARRGGA